MFRSGLGVLAASALLVGGCAGGKSILQPREADGWTTPLLQMGIDGSPDALAEPHFWNTRQISSYDRTGGEYDDRYGHDKFEGGVVLADLEGPGMISRIWTRNPWGTFYLFVDDMEHPIFSAPFRDMFTGALELFSPGFNLFAPPFVGEGSGGYYSYVPIPFEKRCRIVVVGSEDDVLGYEITYVDFPQGAPIKSFELGLNSDDASYFRNWRDNWSNTDLRFHRRATEELHKSSAKVWPQKSYLVCSLDGPGTITELELSIDSVAPDILSETWLVIFFDGNERPGVLTPIGDFFGTTSPEASNYNSSILGNLDGRMWCRFPMPFKRYAEVRLINRTQQIADLKYNVTWKPGNVGDQRYFFARYNSGTTEAGEPYRVADLHGKGHFVGATIEATGGRSLEFLEGDAMYLVDSAPASDFHGTGLDAYFDAGWYMATGPFASPMAGCTLKTPGENAAAAGFRSHVNEPVPFERSFAFDLEHGRGNNQPGMVYTSVAYWYQDDVNPELWTVTDAESLVELFWR